MVEYLPEYDTTRPATAAAEVEHRENGLSVAGKWTIFGLVVFLLCALFGGGAFFMFFWIPTTIPSDDPRYSVAIDSFSGLAGVRTDLALDPEFNLTLRVTSESRRDDACVEPGTYVEVAYRCVTLATSATAQ